ncbi:MAG: protocatechuate 3,4-dioxygenase subunit alpha, partial [Chitinophagales bacterium]
GYENTQIAGGNILAYHRTKGKRIRIRGQVFDGKGNFIPDALVEIWQADAVGNYLNPKFKGFGRMGTGTLDNGFFEFITIKPGSVAGLAPHINLMVFMRGLLVHAYTRIYFSDEGKANERDELLRSIPESRRKTLIAKLVDEGPPAQYLFDIRMQGENETVFLDV